jgi:hypothetical protein
MKNISFKLNHFLIILSIIKILFFPSLFLFLFFSESFLFSFLFWNYSEEFQIELAELFLSNLYLQNVKI